MRQIEKTQGKPKPRRRWLRFSIRSVLLFVAVVAVLFAWLGKYIVRSRIERPVVARIEAAGGAAYYDYQVEIGHVAPANPPPGSQAVRSVLGDDIYAAVNVVFLNGPKTKDDDVSQLHKLSALLDVSLTGAAITDKCVVDLLRIKRLRSLGFSDTSISPSGLKDLSQSETLQSLTLWGLDITDEHLRQLHRFPNLKYLVSVPPTASLS